MALSYRIEACCEISELGFQPMTPNRPTVATCLGKRTFRCGTMVFLVFCGCFGSKPFLVVFLNGHLSCYEAQACKLEALYAFLLLRLLPSGDGAFLNMLKMLVRRIVSVVGGKVATVWKGVGSVVHLRVIGIKEWTHERAKRFVDDHQYNVLVVWRISFRIALSAHWLAGNMGLFSGDWLSFIHVWWPIIGLRFAGRYRLANSLIYQMG